MAKHTIASAAEQFAGQQWSTLRATHGALRSPDGRLEDGTWHLLRQDQTGLPALHFCAFNGADLAIPSPAVLGVTAGRALLNASYRIAFVASEFYDFSKLTRLDGEQVQIELIGPRAATRDLLGAFQAEASKFHATLESQAITEKWESLNKAFPTLQRWNSRHAVTSPAMVAIQREAVARIQACDDDVAMRLDRLNEALGALRDIEAGIPKDTSGYTGSFVSAIFELTVVATDWRGLGSEIARTIANRGGV